MKLQFSLKKPGLFDYIYELAHSRFASIFLICVLFWIVAAASFFGFIEKWGMRDSSVQFGLIAMLDASAQKPFVYRQLIPMAVNVLDQYLPEKIKNYILQKNKPEQIFTRVSTIAAKKYPFKYICICYFIFFSLFFSLFILRKILIDFAVGDVTSIVVSMAFVLCFPYLQTVGGYFYDGPEFLFATLAFWLAMRGRILLLVALAIPATLNKESFFFMLPALYPLLRAKFPAKTAIIGILGAIMVSGIINVLVKLQFSDALGATAEFHLFENAISYLKLYTYHQVESTYGIIGPSGASFFTFLVIATICIRGWPACPTRLRQHILISACINLPLFILFCSAGELRNLSLLFVSFVLLTGFAMDRINLKIDRHAPGHP